LSDYQDLEGKRDDRLVLYGLLSSFRVPERGRTLAGNPIDQAVWNHEKAKSLEAELGHYSVLGRNEFDFERRRTSVLVEERGRTTLIAKGAPESMLKICASAQVGGQSRELTSDLISSITARIAAYESDGLRTIALATKTGEAKTTSPQDEERLVLLGFLLFLDPPKKTVKASLDMLVKLGVEVKIVSGDAAAVTRKICGEVRLDVVEGRILTGEELEGLTPQKFKEAICRYNVFARVSPAQKHRIVEGLGKEGHIVGFLGDGANDAPALRAAHVGISVDTGSGIAKSSADIILLRKSLRVLAHGITEGRKTFANITKYILNTISANYGNMFTVAFSSLFLKFIPLLPSQILLNNLVSDIPMLTVSTDRVDEDSLKRPRRWDMPFISRFMVVFGLISSVFDLMLILVLLFALKASTGLFRTAWFIESLFSELAITFSIRTRLIFVKSRPSGALLFSSFFCGFASLALIFSDVGHSWFEFERVPPAILGFIAGVIALYFVAVEVVKKVFFKRFGG
jgi:Mg2+-importing ATPase